MPCEPGEGLTPQTCDKAVSRLEGWTKRISAASVSHVVLIDAPRKVTNVLSAVRLSGVIGFETPHGDSFRCSTDMLRVRGKTETSYVRRKVPLPRVFDFSQHVQPQAQQHI